MAATLPPDFQERLRALHADGLSANSIAKQLGCSQSTVSKYAKQLGLSFNRTHTRAAVEAHIVDAAARRARLIARGYARAEKLYDRLEAPTFKYRVVYKESTEIVTDEAPPSADERALQAAIAGHMVMVARLEQVDGAPGIAKTASIITRVAEAFGISDA